MAKGMRMQKSDVERRLQRRIDHVEALCCWVMANQLHGWVTIVWWGLGIMSLLHSWDWISDRAARRWRT